MAKKGCGKYGCSNKLTFDKQRLPGGAPSIYISKVVHNFGNSYVGKDYTTNYIVSGTGLTTDITITSDNAFLEISKDGGSTFAASVTLTEVGGVVNATNIILKYNHSAISQTLDTGTVSHTSTGATQKDLSWQANAIFADIIISTDTLSFGNVIIGQSSIVQYTVQAVGLITNLTITSTSAKCLVSLDGGSTWVMSGDLIPDGNGDVAPTLIKIKYTPDSQVTDNCTVNNLGNWAVTEVVTCSGTGVVQTTLYDENFDAAANFSGDIYYFPVNWTSPGSPYEPVNDWAVFDDGEVTFPYSPDSGLRSLVFQGGTSGVQTVTSEPFATTGYVGLTLEYNHLKNSSLSPTLTIEWSDDNSTWSSLTITQPPNDGAWHAQSASLPAGAENKANIYLRFKVTGTGSSDFEAIDDVKVKGLS